MKNARVRRMPAFCVLALALAGCGSGQGAPGIPGAGFVSQAATARSEASRVRQARSKVAGDLLYVGGDRESYVFTYPQGKLVEELPLGSFGMCADRSGNVYFTGVRTITEYAHGATEPIASYTVGGTAFSCAADIETGRLAVVVLCISGCKGDEVAIFDHPGAPPTTYQDPAMKSMLYCGFDGHGNLYVDGYSGSTVTVAELPAGSATFTDYPVLQQVVNPGQIQWDTRHITLEERFHPVIYRLSFTPLGAQVKDTVALQQEGVRAAQSWIFGNAIAIPNGPATKRPLDIRIWAYPKGGTPMQILSHFIPRFREIDGVAFSAAPAR